MMMNMSEYPIAGWHYCGLNRSPEEMMDTWHELGLNLVTLICSAQQKELVLRALDRAETHGIKLILIVSSFHDPEGQLYYVICSNTPDAPTYVTMKFKDGISLEKCAYGNVFVPMPGMRDTVEGVGTAPEHSVGFFLTPGEMILLRETKKI